MESDQQFDEIRKKRIILLLGIWNYFLETKYIDESKFKISYPGVNEIIEHYMTDVYILKYRYKIDKRIERPKIAGLMTSLIMRYRPIMCILDEYEKRDDIYVNEDLAITYGISVCFDDDLAACARFMKESWFDKWFNDFRYLLHVRHYTAECLTLVFKTLTLVFGKERIL